MTEPQSSAAGPYIVRDATPADVPALDACYAHASHGKRVAGADGKTYRYLVVECDGVVGGFARLWLAQPVRGPVRDCIPQVTNVNVRPDLRGRGLATALLVAMEAIARSAGFDLLYIGVDTDNLPAVSLYRKLGYEPLAEQPADPWHGPLSSAHDFQGPLGPENHGQDARATKRPRRDTTIYLAKPLRPAPPQEPPCS